MTTTHISYSPFQQAVTSQNSNLAKSPHIRRLSYNEIKFASFITDMCINKQSSLYNELESWSQKQRLSDNAIKLAHYILDTSRRNATDLCIKLYDIESIPTAIQHLKTLTRVAIIKNALKSQILPDSICQLSLLTHLNVSNNALSSLPSELHRLSNLTLLNVSKNNLTTLPDNFATLSTLTSLDLSDNPLKTLTPKIGKLCNLTILNISNCELTTLPSSLGEIPYLTSLSCPMNQLTKLPREIGRLSELEKLHVAGNPLKDLPDELGNLAKLKKLYCFSCKDLESLPTTLTNLEHLLSLNVSATNPILEAQSYSILAICRFLRSLTFLSTELTDNKANNC